MSFSVIGVHLDLRGHDHYRVRTTALDVVKRALTFHRTLDDELLRYVQPLHDRHLNRLLSEFRKYYNTARPHMTNGVEAPVLPERAKIPAANDSDFFKTPRKLQKVKWLGGLHHSYRWAA